MLTTINISLNIPPAYQMEELTWKLTDFGNWLILSESQTKDSNKHYRHHNLRGLMKGMDASSKELIDEYLKEKYGV